MSIADITSPDDLRALPADQLPALVEDIRAELIATVARQGGHLASNLGVVELTVALHRVFDVRKDVIIFDTGHQSYVHKLLTGRFAAFQKLRQVDGCTGFPNRAESPFDHFGTGHSGTAVSAALGFAAARDRAGNGGKVVAILGDGALGCGSSLEAINNIAVTTRDFILILNDNKMSISPNVGALSRCLSRVISAHSYNRFKVFCAGAVQRIPMIGPRIRSWISRLESATKQLFLPAAFFEELGLRYIGPIDGHDLPRLTDTLRRVRHLHGPRLVHVLTVKGKGCRFAEKNPSCFHGTAPFEPNTGDLLQPTTTATFAATLGQTLHTLHQEDHRIVAITAGMPDGTGLHDFAKAFPDAFYDVGIAEAHAAAFAAGLAAAGQRPVLAVYASFSQRAADYVFHDVCLQKLPVIFCLDRAGVVADGPTHHGIQDVAFWRACPNLAVLQPADQDDLHDMLRMAANRPHPVVIRYPAGNAAPVTARHRPLEWGKAEILAAGNAPVALWAVGRETAVALQAAELLQTRGIAITVVNARFTIPFDADLMRRQLDGGMTIVTLEDHCLEGGFGSIARDCLADVPSARIVKLGWPRAVLPNGPVAFLRQHFSLTPAGIAETIHGLLARPPAPPPDGCAPAETPLPSLTSRTP